MKETPTSRSLEVAVLSSAGHVRVVEVILALCCTLDAADKALLPASFRALQVDLLATPTQLGALSLFQSLAFSLALPYWGSLTLRYRACDLLATGCLIWAVATAALSLSSDFAAHCALRVANGVGLAAVVPISQAVLVSMVPEDQRGAAFGRLQACCSAASMLAAGYAVAKQGVMFEIGPFVLSGWRVVHMQVALASLVIACLVRRYLTVLPTRQGEEAEKQGDATIMQTARVILRIPSFQLLVAQGVIGGIPWNAMSFMSLYFSTVGFTDGQVGLLALAHGAGAALGAVLGGLLGDAAARRRPDDGRPMVALLSVSLGLPLYLMMFWAAPGAGSLLTTGAVVFAFSVAAVWTPPAANRPICAELVSSPAERAQVIAWWVMLEGVSSSVLGAPLVGVLSEHFGYRLDSHGHAAGPEASAALGHALAGVGVICWLLCGAAWVAMVITLPVDKARTRERTSLPEAYPRFGACHETRRD